jgi:hypothetical protein
MSIFDTASAGLAWGQGLAESSGDVAAHQVKSLEDIAKSKYEVNRYKALQDSMKPSPDDTTTGGGGPSVPQPGDLGKGYSGLIKDTQDVQKLQKERDDFQSKNKNLAPEDMTHIDLHLDRMDRDIEAKKLHIANEGEKHIEHLASLQASINSQETLDIAIEKSIPEINALADAQNIPADKRDQFVGEHLVEMGMARKGKPDATGKPTYEKIWDENQAKTLKSVSESNISAKEQFAEKKLILEAKISSDRLAELELQGIAREKTQELMLARIVAGGNNKDAKALAKASDDTFKHATALSNIAHREVARIQKELDLSPEFKKNGMFDFGKTPNPLHETLKNQLRAAQDRADKADDIMDKAVLGVDVSKEISKEAGIKTEEPATKEVVVSHDEDKQAIEWAKANPDTPEAKQILALHPEKEKWDIQSPDSGYSFGSKKKKNTHEGSSH